ncbi:MAG: type VI secretion system tip protein VgrG [Nitrococcus sp.]|nr:type VI secretion system tip protein VgrG [Nitrococcus sp.]
MSVTQRAIAQRRRQISLSTPLGEDVLALRRVEASEELGRMFDYRLDLMSPDDNIAAHDLLGEKVTIRLSLAGGGRRFFNGHISRFVMLGYEGRFAHYEATVVPWLWFLGRTADCRIFQRKTVPEIITAVFREHGFTDFHDTLTDTYRAREYVVQYRETDLSFVSRLMEHEGIYYFFRHEDGKHTLVLADSSNFHSPCPGYEQIPYYPPGEDVVREQECLWSLRTIQEVQSGAVALNDFDFTAPKKSLRSVCSKPQEHVLADFEVYDYPGDYLETGDGDRYSRLRIEERQAEHEVVRGEGNTRGLSVGTPFELTNYPRQDQNREYLVVSASYEIETTPFETGGTSSAPDYRCRFTAIDAKTPFRPRCVTPKPAVQGPQTAMVVGKAGEEIWTDEYGRVKVQFHWDRYGKADENSSCWVRVSQPWAGKNWGMVAIPRIGQEVIVECLEGDPDRPIITGRVYNGVNKPPYALPANAMASGVKSNSTPGGGGYNEISMSDEKGKEKLTVHAQYDMNTTVEHDQTLSVQGNREETVKGTETITINSSRTEHVKGSEDVTIDATTAHTINADFTRKASGNYSLKADGKIDTDAGSTAHHKAATIKLEANSKIELVCGASSITLGPAEIKISSGSGEVTLHAPGVDVKGAMIKLN